MLSSFDTGPIDLDRALSLITGMWALDAAELREELSLDLANGEEHVLYVAAEFLTAHFCAWDAEVEIDENGDAVVIASDDFLAQGWMDDDDVTDIEALTVREPMSFASLA